MDYEVWLGSEKSYQDVQKYLMQFRHTEFNKEAFFTSPFDRETPELDPVYGVDSQRVGLTILQKAGDRTVIKVAGSLTPNFSRWHAWLPGESTSYEAIRDALAICEEAGIKDVLMHYDSSGGSVRGLAQTSDAMKRYQRSGGKIHAHSESLVASAAYWLYCGADQATAAEMAEVGSIGTMAVVRSMVNTEQTMGVKFTVIKAGKYKAVGNPFEDLSAEDKAYLQKNIDETNQFFLNRVSIERNLMLSDTGVWAEGQLFFAGKALAAGLIDKVAKMDDLIGSGPAAKNTSDTRRFSMEISAEKLAQIQAGADPKVVLSADELKIYMESMDQANKGTTQVPAVEPQASTPAAKEPQEPQAPPAAAGATMSDALASALRENGRLEVKMEQHVAELEKLRQANEALSKDMDALLVVAQASVCNLQRALQRPQMAHATVPEVLAQYTGLMGDMAKTFKVGQQSAAAATADNTKTQAAADGGQIDYRLQAATKTGR